MVKNATCWQYFKVSIATGLYIVSSLQSVLLGVFQFFFTLVSISDHCAASIDFFSKREKIWQTSTVFLASAVCFLILIFQPSGVALHLDFDLQKKLQIYNTVTHTSHTVEAMWVVFQGNKATSCLVENSTHLWMCCLVTGWGGSKSNHLKLTTVGSWAGTICCFHTQRQQAEKCGPTVV